MFIRLNPFIFELSQNYDDAPIVLGHDWQSWKFNDFEQGNVGYEQAEEIGADEVILEEEMLHFDEKEDA